MEHFENRYFFKSNKNNPFRNILDILKDSLLASQLFLGTFLVRIQMSCETCELCHKSDEQPMQKLGKKGVDTLIKIKNKLGREDIALQIGNFVHKHAG